MDFSEICLVEAYEKAGGLDAVTEAEFVFGERIDEAAPRSGRFGQMRVKAKLDLSTTFGSVLRFIATRIEGVSNMQISDFSFEQNKVVVYFSMLSTRKAEIDKRTGEPLKYTQSEIINNLMLAAKQNRLQLFSMG